MKIPAHSPDEYFDLLPGSRRDDLGAVRAMIKRVWPKIREDLEYGMPTYHLGGHTFCALASQKSYMALYIMPHDLLHAFKMDLRTHDHGRSCIRFRHLDQEKTDLLERVVKYTGSRFTESIYHGKHAHPGLRLARA